jgi:hypothetical protein
MKQAHAVWHPDDVTVQDDGSVVPDDARIVIWKGAHDCPGDGSCQPHDPFDVVGEDVPDYQGRAESIRAAIEHGDAEVR